MASILNEASFEFFALSLNHISKATIKFEIKFKFAKGQRIHKSQITT